MAVSSFGEIRFPCIFDGMTGKSGGACKKMSANIRDRSHYISHGQNRCAGRRSPDIGRSPARYRAARIRTAGKKIVIDPDEGLEIVLHAPVIIILLISGRKKLSTSML